MKELLVYCCAAVVSVSAFADQDAEALRKEFEAYKLESDARIEALENSAGEPRIPGGVGELPILDLEFHSYFRSGIGVNGNGDAMEAFGAPNAGAKYRLGNEAETYIETTFQQNFRTPELIENDVDFFTRLTFAYVTPTTDNNSFDTTISLREAYAGARGIWSGKKEAQFWAGNRFYENLDIHMNDFYFRDMSGFGGGVEDVSLGDEMKWAVAWMGGSIDELDSSGVAYVNDYHFNKNTLDLRLYEIPAGIGTLALSFDLADFAGDTLDDGITTVDIEDSFGWAAGAVLTSDLTPEMANRFSIQYGTGAADNFRTVITAPQGIDLSDPALTHIATDNTKRLRITDDIVIDNGSPLSLQCAAVYEYYDNGSASMNEINWISLGARPVYHFSDFFALAFEAGADYTNQSDGGDEGVVTKFTLAPQLQPSSKHFSRPVIRAFFTYALWSDDFKGDVASSGYGTETQGISAGVQMEAWW